MADVAAPIGAATSSIAGGPPGLIASRPQRMIIITPHGVPYFTPSRYSFGALVSRYGFRFHGLPKPHHTVSCEFWKSIAADATPSHEEPSPGTSPASL